MSQDFKAAVYEIAFGENAINRDFSEEEVLAKLREFSDKSLQVDEAEEFATEINDGDLCIIPANLDETATAWCEGLVYKSDITGWTPDLIEEMYAHCEEDLPEDFIELSIEDMLSSMEEDLGVYGMTHFFVVHRKFLPQIEEWSSHAIDSGGDDSEWYDNCAEYHEKIRVISEKCINLATGEVDECPTGMVKVVG